MATGEEFWKKVASGEIRSVNINTFQPFDSPIDGEHIASRKSLREHEKRHGVVQVGDAWDGEVKELREERLAQQKEEG